MGKDCITRALCGSVGIHLFKKVLQVVIAGVAARVCLDRRREGRETAQKGG